MNFGPAFNTRGHAVNWGGAHFYVQVLVEVSSYDELNSAIPFADISLETANAMWTVIDQNLDDTNQVNLPQKLPDITYYMLWRVGAGPLPDATNYGIPIPLGASYGGQFATLSIDNFGGASLGILPWGQSGIFSQLSSAEYYRNLLMQNEQGNAGLEMMGWFLPSGQFGGPLFADNIFITDVTVEQQSNSKGSAFRKLTASYLIEIPGTGLVGGRSGIYNIRINTGFQSSRNRAGATVFANGASDQPAFKQVLPNGGIVFNPIEFDGSADDDVNEADSTGGVSAFFNILVQIVPNPDTTDTKKRHHLHIVVQGSGTASDGIQ